MSKYTLNTYGWSFEAICKSLTDEQVQIIKDKMEEEGFSELHEIRFDLDELLDMIFGTVKSFTKLKHLTMVQCTLNFLMKKKIKY